MTIAHTLGLPRIGINRSMKKAVEAYWRGELSAAELEQTGNSIQQYNWAMQAAAELDWVTVGDFSWYDHVLDTSVLLGVIPDRFRQQPFQDSNGLITLDTAVCMARGQAPNGQETTACEMTKWFDTNYHYIVPEFERDQSFAISCDRLFNAVTAAQTSHFKAKPVLLGPLTYLWLGKVKGESFDKLTLLDRLLPVYEQICARLASQQVEWIQIDEPILSLDLPADWQAAFKQVYQNLNCAGLKTLLTTYFAELSTHLQLACELPTTGLHIDYTAAPQELTSVIQALPSNKILSIGIVNGRNVWRTDLTAAFTTLTQAKASLGDRLWVSTSCSLLHCPLDLEQEKDLNPEIKSWLAFAKQKLTEIAILARGLREGPEAIDAELVENDACFASRRSSPLIHNPAVQARLQTLPANADQRAQPYTARASQQQTTLRLPLFPTTTIGSFPQTSEIRHVRHEFRSGVISQATYVEKIQQAIAEVIRHQEALGLDVLVHGEAERNDMVEYFGELLNGFAFTNHGWVQSYGSRCVKPPIIFGDVSRPAPMTVAWSQYAQSLTSKYVKGMLTGPITILSWSFVRDDQPQKDTALQIALALRDETLDLEAAGIQIIQIDEPAFREHLPLRRAAWSEYLDWAARCFRIAASGVNDQTQIHTHMCYSEFNDIIAAIASLDADVITLESSRSDMELLEAFQDFAYPNEIGPGIYDIHSPRIPTQTEILALLDKALQFIPAKRLWVNPDCGLKTRGWPEVKAALTAMVAAAQQLRQRELSATEALATVNDD